jgi:hypothetical protein
MSDWSSLPGSPGEPSETAAMSSTAPVARRQAESEFGPNRFLRIPMTLEVCKLTSFGPAREIAQHQIILFGLALDSRIDMFKRSTGEIVRNYRHSRSLWLLYFSIFGSSPRSLQGDRFANRGPLDPYC